MEKLLLISEIKCAVIRRKIKTLFVLLLALKTKYPSTIKAIFGDIEDTLSSLPYAFSERAVTETLYEIVQVDVNGQEVSRHPKKFKTPEEAIAEYETEYKSRKKGDNYDEYWRNVPIIIRKLIKTTEIVKEYNREPIDHDWFKKDASNLRIGVEVKMSELLEPCEIAKIKELLEHSDLKGMREFLCSPSIKERVESKGVSCDYLYNYIFDKMSFFM